MKARYRTATIDHGKSYYSEVVFDFGPEEPYMLNGGGSGASLSVYPKDPAELRALSSALFRAADSLEAKQSPKEEPCEP